MKYIIIILCLVLSSCGNRPYFNKDSYITGITVNSSKCLYTFNDGSWFIDSCGKFNIGDIVTTCKKN
jgi:hypothetical protein